MITEIATWDSTETEAFSVAAAVPVTGSSHWVNLSVKPNTIPMAKENTDSTTIGPFINQEASCGCTSLPPSNSVVHRFSPWKIMKNSRDM